MIDLLLAVGEGSAVLSADAKWIIGLMATAIVGLFVFLKLVFSKVFTLFGSVLVKEAEDFKTEIKTMHNEGILELKAIKKQQNKMSTNLTLLETHTSESKHAIQNLPCNPKEGKKAG